jgi:hypothetical protein
MSSFTAADLLDCYARGVFPMADSRHDARLFLIDPEKRGVIPLDRFHLSKRLAPVTKRQPNTSTPLSCRFTRDGFPALELNDVPVGAAQARHELACTYRIGTNWIQTCKTIDHI